LAESVTVAVYAVFERKVEATVGRPAQAPVCRCRGAAVTGVAPVTGAVTPEMAVAMTVVAVPGRGRRRHLIRGFVAVAPEP